MAAGIVYIPKRPKIASAQLPPLDEAPPPPRQHNGRINIKVTIFMATLQLLIRFCEERISSFEN